MCIRCLYVLDTKVAAEEERKENLCHVTSVGIKMRSSESNLQAQWKTRMEFVSKRNKGVFWLLCVFFDFGDLFSEVYFLQFSVL